MYGAACQEGEGMGRVGEGKNDCDVLIRVRMLAVR